MKIDVEYVSKMRIKKEEELKFATDRPNIKRFEHIKHCGEILDMYTRVNLYSTTAKNLAYKIIYDDVWWPADNTVAGKVANYKTMFDGIANTTQSDKDLFEEAVLEENLTKISNIINNYLEYDESKHVSIVDLALSPKYINMYKDAYDRINAKLDVIKAEALVKYDEIVANNETLPEEQREFIVGVDEYIDMYIVYAGDLLKGIARGTAAD